jgi:quinol monooxygenase YgiN
MSEEIIVTMEVTVHAQGAQCFAQMDGEALRDTRHFQGCNSVRIMRNKDDPTRFLFIESWTSEQAYRNYIAWRSESGQFQVLQALASAMDIKIWPQTIASV